LLEKQSLAAGARLFPVVKSYQFQSKANALGRHKLAVNCDFGMGIEIDVPLLGEHQVLNALTAIKVSEILRSAGFQITREHLQHGIGRTCWPGRMEIIGLAPMVLLDGAHNPAAATCVKEYIQKFLKGKQIILVFAAMRDKAFTEMGKILFPFGKDIVLTKILMERAADPLQIAKELPEFKARYHYAEGPESAIQLAGRVAGPEDVILVVGSLFLVGEVRLLLNNASAA
jgi:dihydrofolate synthase/folylpolyglutamate synthase